MFWVPLTRERPPVSNARLSAAGLVARKLVGASEAVMMLARYVARAWRSHEVSTAPAIRPAHSSNSR